MYKEPSEKHQKAIIKQYTCDHDLKVVINHALECYDLVSKKNPNYYEYRGVDLYDLYKYVCYKQDPCPY